MPPNIKVYRVHRLLAVLYGLLMLGCALAVFFGTRGAGMSTAASAGSITPILLFFGAIAAAHYYTGQACRKGKSGGRAASTVIACFMLLGFPIGTLIGAYLLYNNSGWPKGDEPVSAEAKLDF